MHGKALRELQRSGTLCYNKNRRMLKEECAMATEDVNVLNYIVVCISEFANRHGIHMRDAYIYLSQNKGIEFLKEFYDVKHTLSFDDVMDNLAAICRKNGGAVG